MRDLTPSQPHPQDLHLSRLQDTTLGPAQPAHASFLPLPPLLMWQGRWGGTHTRLVMCFKRSGSFQQGIARKNHCEMQTQWTTSLAYAHVLWTLLPDPMGWSCPWSSLHYFRVSLSVVFGVALHHCWNTVTSQQLAVWIPRKGWLYYSKIMCYYFPHTYA